MAHGGLQQRLHLFGVAAEAARDKGGAGDHRFQRQVDGRHVVGAVILEELAFIGGGGELPLGQPIDAVVLDDVDEGHIAADDVLELPHADRAGVAVAADRDAGQVGIGQQRAGDDRRHAPVQGVEAVRAAQEIGGRLAGAADAADFDDLVLLQAQLISHADDLVGDGIVPAAGAERAGAAFVFVARQAEVIGPWWHD